MALYKNKRNIKYIRFKVTVNDTIKSCCSKHNQQLAHNFTTSAHKGLKGKINNRWCR